MTPYLISFLFIFVIQLIFFLYAYVRKTDKVTDLAYGLTFVALAWFLVIYYQITGLAGLALVGVVTIWGIRLAGYLFVRILSMGKDKRFDVMRQSFLRFGFFWLLQAVSIFVIMLPVIALLSAEDTQDFSLISGIGLMISLLGIVIEGIADVQKFRFKQKPDNKGKLIKSGFWKHSRHPNYFGEMLMWIGISMSVIPYLDGLSYLTLISPIYIVVLLRFVSGVPTIENRWEEKYGDDPEFQKYMQETNMIVPFI